MKLLTVLSLLMDYPEDNSEELIAVLRIGVQLMDTPPQAKQKYITILISFKILRNYVAVGSAI